MNKLKMNLKSREGITLVALVVTIIVLVILAGVAINLVLRQNGIIGRAKEATRETNKAEATEKINLKITNIQISSYTETQKLPNLQYLADKLCEDNDMEYVLTASKEHASLDKIDVTNISSIFTKLKEYPYEFEINSSLQLASIDGIKIATVPSNDDDTIVKMTKAELNTYIENAINSKLNSYFCTSNATTTSSASSNRPAVVIENYKDENNNWYRVWSDGWIEQGGISIGKGSETGATTTFIKPFQNNNYTLTTSDAISSHTNQASCAFVVTNKDINGFSISSSWVTDTSWVWANLTFSWYACGY